MKGSGLWRPDRPMVTPNTLASLCPQCGADIRLSGNRCQSCGFLLTMAPPPRTRPLSPRPLRSALSSRRTIALVLGAGGAVVVALLALGTSVQLRRSDAAAPSSAVAPTATTPLASAPTRLDPNRLLGESRRKATAWHRDAVLLGLTAGPLDASGVITEGKVEVVYGKPTGERVSGGAEAGTERYVLVSTGGELVGTEAKLGRARIAPEPSCLFEDAWAAAQRAGADPQAASSLRYAWSEKYARTIWEVTSTEGQVLRRLDGVSCGILTR